MNVKKHRTKTIKSWLREGKKRRPRWMSATLYGVCVCGALCVPFVKLGVSFSCRWIEAEKKRSLQGSRCALFVFTPLFAPVDFLFRLLSFYLIWRKRFLIRKNERKEIGITRKCLDHSWIFIPNHFQYTLSSFALLLSDYKYLFHIYECHNSRCVMT